MHVIGGNLSKPTILSIYWIARFLSLLGCMIYLSNICGDEHWLVFVLVPLVVAVWGTTGFIEGLLEQNDLGNAAENLLVSEKKTSKNPGIIYHLSCRECGKTWWSEEAFPNKCPYCESNLKAIFEEKENMVVSKE